MVAALEKRIAEMTQKARILIVDDHPSVREGLMWRMSKLTDLEICGEAADAEDALRKFKKLRPDLVLVDVSLKQSNGLDLVKRLVALGPVKALVHSTFDESIYAERALEAGAMGYINKEESGDQLIAAIREVLNGRIYLSVNFTQQMLKRRRSGAPPAVNMVENLSDRELEIFQLIGQGLVTGEIARQLNLSPHTLDTHRANIKRKLGLQNAAELNRAASVWVHENA